MARRFGRLALLLAVILLAGSFRPLRSALAQSVDSPIVEPDDGRQPILDFISTARTSVDLAIYELSDRRVLAALESAAGRGVSVRVLAEPLPGGRPVNARAIGELSQKGIQTRNSSPSFRLTHQKTLVVDGSRALIMSLNLVAATFDGSRDAAILDTDPGDVAEIEAVFDADWNRAPILLSQPDLVWSPDNARSRLLALIDSATQTLDVYAEELTDRQILAALDAAAGRGVEVRLLMTDVGSRDSARPGRAQLKAAGGEVRLLQKPFVHAKVIVVDGLTVFAGSENFSTASLDQNRELGIISSDVAIVGRLSAVFQQDWSQAKPLAP